eukprot:CAMPEP_0183585166 /NCGR_PEP_ID=MMETSP0371-20130417/154791_1 /TAXON_ID=268820 /ORGANISM="Peridinium aciculiferum, Strain PAER-2" /LENGTH=34 /DNA_ID= /DNA_START= /DNA_END= /DNA_ORIENTATION=
MPSCRQLSSQPCRDAAAPARPAAVVGGAAKVAPP